MPSGASGQCWRSFSAFCAINSFTCVSISTLVSGQFWIASLHRAAMMWLLPLPVGKTRHGLPVLFFSNQL